jgi:hypothetical protein
MFKCTSVPSRSQNFRESLREGGARHYLAAACTLRLHREFALHVRKEADDGNIPLRGADFFDGLNGLATGIQVHDDQLRQRIQQAEESVGIGGNFQFHTDVLSGFRDFHLKEQIIHQSNHSGHVTSLFLEGVHLRDQEK